MRAHSWLKFWSFPHVVPNAIQTGLSPSPSHWEKAKQMLVHWQGLGEHSSHTLGSDLAHPTVPYYSDSSVNGNELRKDTVPDYNCLTFGCTSATKRQQKRSLAPGEFQFNFCGRWTKDFARVDKRITDETWPHSSIKLTTTECHLIHTGVYLTFSNVLTHAVAWLNCQIGRASCRERV